MPPLQVGTVLKNRYRISSILYSNPLTNIYKVDDTHLIGNIWAVKEMKIFAVDNLERQRIISQFRKDFVRMTELSHPNLARVIDYFVEGQNFYIIREFIPAYDIAAIMSRNQGFINEKEVLMWAAQLAEALLYLYKKKFPAIFYRDLSLISILISAEGELKIIDLGIAWLFQAENDPIRVQNIGAVEYASPEQFDDRGVFNERSLVYTLGAILHHILTNQSPSQHLFNLPDVSEVNPGVSKNFSFIVKKATDKKPLNRYSSLMGMKKDILKVKKEADSASLEGDNSFFVSKGSCFLIFILLGLIGAILFLLYKILF